MKASSHRHKVTSWAQLEQAVVSSGGRLRRANHGLWVYGPLESAAPFSISGTPSDHRALANAVSRARRSGVKV